MKENSDDRIARLDVLKTSFIRRLAQIVVATTRYLDHLTSCRSRELYEDVLDGALQYLVLTVWPVAASSRYKVILLDSCQIALLCIMVYLLLGSTRKRQ